MSDGSFSNVSLALMCLFQCVNDSDVSDVSFSLSISVFTSSIASHYVKPLLDWQ